DVGRFLRYFAHPAAGPLKKDTVAAMITNQNQGLNTPWGIGWSMGKGFGKQSSPKTFGHGGSTGTLSWMDPEKDVSFVLLNTKPSAASGRTLLTPVSDVISDVSETLMLRKRLITLALTLAMTGATLLRAASRNLEIYWID